MKNVGILSSDCYEGERLFCPWKPIAAAEAVEWLYRASLLGPTTGRDNGGGGSGGGGSGGGGGGFGGGGGSGGGGGGFGGGGSGGGGGGFGGGGGSGGGGGGGGNGGGGGGGNGGDNPSTTNPPTTTLPPLIPTLVGNDDIDLVDGECTHHDRHLQGGADPKSYMILDGTYPVALVFDDEGPYTSVSGQDEYFRYDDLPPNENVIYRYRVEQNTIRSVYFSHWHVAEDIRWVYWIPETVLERVEDSEAAPIPDEVLFGSDSYATAPNTPTGRSATSGSPPTSSYTTARSHRLRPSSLDACHHTKRRCLNGDGTGLLISPPRVNQAGPCTRERLRLAVAKRR